MKRSSLRPRAASSFPWLPEEQCCARGQWEAIVDHETWCRSRNSRHHRARHEHLGLDQAQAPGFGPVPLYSVWLQGDGAPRGYRCAGHVRRTGSHIDELVTEVIAGRLGQPDALAKHQTSGEASETSGISAAVAEQRGRILRAQRDYDTEVIEGCDLKRIREAAEARIVELEAERLLRDRGGVLAPILGTEDTAAAFREAPLEVRRQVIDTLATVTLHAQPRGRRGFDPASVTVEWRWQSRQSATVSFWA